MKRSHTILIGLILMLLSLPALSQLSGIKNVPGDYPTLAAAIADLNASGAGAGGVTIRVAAGHNETLLTPTSGAITTLTGSVANPIVITRWGTGSNPLITAYTGKGSMDAIISISGCDYLTIDGIDLTENPANGDPDQWIEWGYAILKHSAINGSQNITIRNCTIGLSPYHTSSVGICSANHTNTSLTLLTVTELTGANSRLKIYGNYLNNCYSGIILNGFNDPAAPYAYYDQGNEIGKDGPNTITNVAGLDLVAGYGIFCSGQNSLKVANNQVTSVMGGSGTPYGIFLTNAENGSYDLYGNSVTMQFWGEGSTSFFPIYCDMGANGTSNVVNAYNNTVSGCTFPTATSGYSYLFYLYNMGVISNVYGNVVSGNTIGASDVAATGRIFYLYCNKNTMVMGPMEFHDNTVNGNIREQISPLGGLTQFMAVHGKGTLLNVYNNTVTDNTVASSSGTYLLNVSFDIGERNIYDNIVAGISRAEGIVYGLYNYNVTANSGIARIYRNRITNIEGVTAGSNINGIYSSAAASATYIYNNMISDLRAVAANYTFVSIAGLFQSQGPLYAFNNTIFLNCTSTGTNFSSSAFYTQNGSSFTELRNNIFVNRSEPKGSGKTTALRFSNVNLINFSALSNYNLLYAGVPSSSRLIFTDGTNNDQTLADYKTRVFPRDVQSVTEMPPFEDITAGSVNTHLSIAIATQCEAGGSIIVSPVAVTSDYDGEPRYPYPGYPHGVFMPQSADIGADEFDGVPNDLSVPAIQITPLLNTSAVDERTLIVTFTDGSGVPATGSGIPMLYWSVNAGPFLGVQGTPVSDGSFSFTFGGGVVVGDVIQYYFVAQDLSPAANVIAFPTQGAGGYTISPPSCTTPPATPYSYSIMQGISGVFHVGAGKDYTRLTDAALDINSKVLSGPVTLILDDATYPSEVYPVTFSSNPGSSAVNTITIRPETGVSPQFSTSSPGGILDLNGIDYLIIDGSNSGGTSRNLTFDNGSSMASSYGIQILNNGGNDPVTHLTIRNCIVKCQPVHATIGNVAIVIFPAGGSHSDILFENNWIKSAFNGIEVAGIAGAPCHRIRIINNTIGSEVDAEAITHAGITISYSDSTLVSDNEIMGPKSGSLNIGQTGVNIGSGSTNTVVTKNRIHDFFRSADDGWGVSGIWYSGEATSVTEISNNMIYDIKSPGINPGLGQNITYGIFIRSGGNLRILHNSINLFGSWLSTSYNASSACIAFYYQVTGGNIDVRNNIFRNAMNVMGTPTSDGKAYGIMISGPPAMFTNLNHNDYYIDGYNGMIAQYFPASSGNPIYFPTLASWQAYTGQEQASQTINPGFFSNVNLVPTTPSLNNLGEYLLQVPTDFAGVNRNDPSDMGALEFGNDPMVVTTEATSISPYGAILNGTVNPRENIVTTAFDYGSTTSYGYSIPAVPVQISGTNTTQFSGSVSGLKAGTVYHFRARTISNGGVISYGSDMTFMIPNLIPDSTHTSGTVGNGTDTCYNATETITVAGNGSTFTVVSGGSATFIAGQRILFLPGTTVLSGGVMTGRIATDGQYCQALSMPAVSVNEMPDDVEKTDRPDGDQSLPQAESGFTGRIYPNPVVRNFTVEIAGAGNQIPVQVMVFSMTGSKILEFSMTGETRREISAGGLEPGMYFIRFIAEGAIKTLKFIKR